MSMSKYRDINIGDKEFHKWCMSVQSYQKPPVETRVENLLHTIRNEIKHRHTKPLFGTQELKRKIVRAIIRIMCRNVRLYQKFVEKYNH